MPTTAARAKILACLATGSLLLSACVSSTRGGGGGPSSSQGSGTSTQDQTVAVAWEQEFASYNDNTADQNATRNRVVLNQVLTGFWEYGQGGEVSSTPEFGTYQKTSDDPLTVRYVIGKDTAWSDGTPFDCDDFLLHQAAMSGRYTGPGKGGDGTPQPLFNSAGTAGYESMQTPKCEAGDKQVEVTYAKPFADWRAMFGQMMMPAHVLERETGLSEAELIAAVINGDQARLTAVADFWNTGWLLKPGELKPDLMPSLGPYLIGSWNAGESLELRANDKYWAAQAKSSTIKFRYISAEQQALALQNNEVQVISPQPQSDVLQQLRAIGDAVTVDQHDEYSYEHLDFNFKGPFGDPDLRRAFALCVPRQQIVQTLIRPINPQAVVMNARYAFPFQDDYEAIVDATRAADYLEPTIAEAKQILDSKGRAGMPVRIGYPAGSKRRTDAVRLITQTCNKAGFTVQDAGQEDFLGDGLSNGDFDVALFAWSGSPLATAQSATFVTGGGNNKGRYSNPKVDRLTSELNTMVDEDQQGEQIGRIEKILWDDLVTIPLFAFPAVDAWSTRITGIKPQVSQSQITWNMDEWNVRR